MRLISFVLFFLASASSRVAGISSKVDLDDDEATTPPKTLTPTVLKAFLDLNQPRPFVATKGSSGFVGKQPQPNVFRLPGRPDDDEFINIEDLFRDRQQPTIANRADAMTPQTDREEGSTIINNIHVTIAGNVSSPDVSGCKNGICNVTVSSKEDGNGNVVTNVQLSVVTKLIDRPAIKNVPVIDGSIDFRKPEYDQIPPFHFYDPDNRYDRPSFDNNIPPLPIHRHDVDSWYREQPSFFQRHRNAWYFGRKLNRDNERNVEGSRWDESRHRGIVDDKIEPPLSKTKSSTS